MINFTNVGVHDAKALLNAVAACGVTAPKRLTDLVDALDELRATPATAVDPTRDLLSPS